MIVQDYAYSPFGAPVQATGGQTNPLQYTGEQWEETTGLLYLRARWYDPDTGRFLTPDPFPGFAAYPPSLNAYVYTFNDPISLTDPSGEFPVVAAALYAVGYVGYDQADKRVKRGVGRAALDVVGFMTGYENIQQDWGIMTNGCTSIQCKISATIDMGLNISSGVSLYSGIGKGIAKYGRLGNRLAHSPTHSLPVKISRVGKTIKVKQVETKLTKSGLFRIPHTTTILAPPGKLSSQELAHEASHIFQEFGTTGLEHKMVRGMHRASIYTSLTKPQLMPLYVLNPTEVQAIGAGIFSRRNLELFAANRGLLGATQFTLQEWCEK